MVEQWTLINRQFRLDQWFFHHIKPLISRKPLGPKLGDNLALTRKSTIEGFQCICKAMLKPLIMQRRLLLPILELTFHQAFIFWMDTLTTYFWSAHIRDLYQLPQKCSKSLLTGIHLTTKNTTKSFPSLFMFSCNVKLF